MLLRVVFTYRTMSQLWFDWRLVVNRTFLEALPAHQYRAPVRAQSAPATACFARDAGLVAPTRIYHKKRRQKSDRIRQRKQDQARKEEDEQLALEVQEGPDSS